MHIPSDFLDDGRGFTSVEDSATSDNTSDEKIGACSHGISATNVNSLCQLSRTRQPRSSMRNYCKIMFSYEQNVEFGQLILRK